MNVEKFTPQLTADGSFTFFSPEFGETFHSHYGARQEAEFKFVRPVRLRLKAHQPIVKLLDICYGLGYNTASALAAIWEVNPACRVELVGLELDTEVPKAAIAGSLLKSWPSPIPELLETLAANWELQTESIQAKLLIGDARSTIRQVKNSGFQADAIFLDPFSPPNCPQLWTVEFLGLASACLQADGRLATYSCSAAVRSALMAAGFSVGSTAPVGRRSPGTVASFHVPRQCPPAALSERAGVEAERHKQGEDLPKLSEQEQEHLLTRAAIPYRDPDLCDSKEAIIHRRQLEQENSSLEPTSHWKKRWSNK